MLLDVLLCGCTWDHRGYWAGGCPEGERLHADLMRAAARPLREWLPALARGDGHHGRRRRMPLKAEAAMYEAGWDG